MAHNSKHALNDDISGIELYNYEDNCICNKMRGDNPICLVHHFNAVTNAVTMCNVNADGDNNKSWFQFCVFCYFFLLIVLPCQQESLWLDWDQHVGIMSTDVMLDQKYPTMSHCDNLSWHIADVFPTSAAKCMRGIITLLLMLSDQRGLWGGTSWTMQE